MSLDSTSHPSVKYCADKVTAYWVRAELDNRMR